MRKHSFFIAPMLALALTPVQSVSAAGNPYPLNGHNWGNCTWGAWQLAYEKLGVELPGMGNAQEWFANAAGDGYSTGSDPAANSIVVWSGGRSGLGHVAYVDYVNDDGTLFIEEGSGANHNYNARTVDPDAAGMTLLGYIYVSTDTSPVLYDLDAASMLGNAERQAVNDAITEYTESKEPIAEYTVDSVRGDPAKVERPVPDGPAPEAPSLSEPAPVSPSLESIQIAAREGIVTRSGQ